MRFSSAVGALLIALAFTSAAASAHATEEDAKTFFAEGRRLRLADDCANAIVAFRRALDVYPEGLGSLRNIAECEEKLGEFASARNDWWALRRAALGSNEARYAGWDKDSEAGYNRLADKVAKLTVKLEGTAVERVRVAIDGKPLDPRLYGIALERDLGQHTIEAAYGGVSPIVAHATLTVGSKEVVVLKIPSPAEAQAARLAQVTPSSSGATRTGGFIALGVGILALGGMGVSIGVRQSALSSIAGICPDYATAKCPAKDKSQLEPFQSKGTTASTLANVFGAVGIVGVGAGATLLVVSLQRHAPEADRPAASLSVTPLFGGGAARAEVKF